MHEQGHIRISDPFNSFIKLVVERGSVEVMQWMLQNGYTMSAELCLVAVQNGRLVMLQWLRQQGCPWDKAACRGEAGNIGILEWIDAQV